MAKSIKLKCAFSTLVLFFTADRLYKATLRDDGGITIKDDYGTKHDLSAETLRLTGETSFGEPLEARFVTMKTKTIMCRNVDHRASVQKHFKKGKRYQIEMNRALGGVAGSVFDEDGDSWTLSRERVGFSAGGGIYHFEALYS